MDTIEIPDVLKPVTEHINHAYLIAWDGCHKIYLALDEIESAWFATHYEQIVRAEPDVMMATIVRWWNESCGLRFVSGVRHNADNPNDGFVQIVEQFAEDEEDN